MNPEILEILSKAKTAGWVMEPPAKRLLSLAGIAVPRFAWAKTEEEAVQFAEQIGYPVVAKVVSSKIIHKTEVKGVQTGIEDSKTLVQAFERLSRLEGCEGILVEETRQGLEVIIGAKIDYQFGPIVLMGIGGTAAEIYQDSVLRMAPLNPEDVEEMIMGLKAHRLFEGYRGADVVDRDALTALIMSFSQLIMELDDQFESIDLNPVFCGSSGCVVGDARIMLP